MKKGKKLLKIAMLTIVVMLCFNIEVKATLPGETGYGTNQNAQNGSTTGNSTAPAVPGDSNYGNNTNYQEQQNQDHSGSISSGYTAPTGPSNALDAIQKEQEKQEALEKEKERVEGNNNNNSEEKDNNDSVNTNDDMGNLDYERLCNLEIIDDIKNVWKMICIIAPILVVLLGSIDYAQAVISQDEQQMKKSVSKFTKRLIIGVALFFLPYLVRLIFAIANEAGLDKVINDVLCGI